jgi:hypothetical protein
MTEQVNDLQVNPAVVIGILKARLSEEISRSAVLEAALQDARAREAAHEQITSSDEGDSCPSE